MSWIKTYTGEKFYVTAPDLAKINIVDIAHSLAMQCRFGGHCRRFYSVAEHSINVANIGGGLDGLLHDGSEGYLVDIPSPIKHSLELEGYCNLERIVQNCIDDKFGVNHESVKHFDNIMLAIEIYQLMPNPLDYDVVEPTKSFGLQCWSPAEAERNFLDAFYSWRG